MTQEDAEAILNWLPPATTLPTLDEDLNNIQYLIHRYIHPTNLVSAEDAPAPDNTEPASGMHVDTGVFNSDNNNDLSMLADVACQQPDDQVQAPYEITGPTAMGIQTEEQDQAGIPHLNTPEASYSDQDPAPNQNVDSDDTDHGYNSMLSNSDYGYDSY